MTQHPLCFVLMPFGQKRDPGTGKMIDFDRVYEEAIRPAVLAAEMDPIRADEERVGGIIQPRRVRPIPPGCQAQKLQPGRAEPSILHRHRRLPRLRRPLAERTPA